MTTDEARSVALELVGRTAFERIEAFLHLVIDENERQNLIAPSTIPTIWVRHVLDSTQLLRLTPSPAKTWLDVGTGGGFPGMVIALATTLRVTLVEPRRRRADFLAGCVKHFSLEERVRVEQRDVERIDGQFDVISARAVASVRKLLQAAAHCGTSHTRWLLPRGKLNGDDMAVLAERQALFHVEQSITGENSSILVIEHLPL